MFQQKFCLSDRTHDRSTFFIELNYVWSVLQKHIAMTVIVRLKYYKIKNDKSSQN